MNKKYYCELKEHYNQMQVCLYSTCDYRSRLICKICNHTQFHNHDQNDNFHIIDLQYIIKNQKILKDQRQEYHQQIDKINKLQNDIYSCVFRLQRLKNQIYQKFVDYNQFIDNLLFIQSLIDLKDFHKIDSEIAQKISMINEYNFSETLEDIQNQFQSIKSQINQIQFKIDNLILNNSSIIHLIDKQQDICEAIVSSNDKFVLYTTKNQLFYYDINKQVKQAFDIGIHALSLSLIQDNQLLYIGQEIGKFLVYNVNKNFKYRNQQIFQRSEKLQIMSISKTMAIIIEENSQQYRMMNLKTNKIMFKLQLQDVIDIYYDEDYQILILVHQMFINIVTINTKFKQNRQIHNIGDLVKSQYCQQSKQLLLLNEQDLLTFWDLSNRHKGIECLKQIKLLLKDHSYFIYIGSLEQLFSINSEKIMIQNNKGDILQEIEHCYQKELCTIYKYFKVFSNFYFQFQSQKYICLHLLDSISLIKLEKYDM